MKKVAVILSGSGVYDGAEIQESVFTLLHLAQKGIQAICFAPNINQFHVINHVNGEEMDETRNVLVEAARIARGEIFDLEGLNVNDFDGLIIPGGFGAAKNLTTWAFDGPEGGINMYVRKNIIDFTNQKKPIVALCMGPTVVAKALEDKALDEKLTVGTVEQNSTYDIAGISSGMNKLGANTVMTSKDDILYDEVNNIITAPCYMMEVGIVEVNNNIEKAILKLKSII